MRHAAGAFLVIDAALPNPTTYLYLRTKEFWGGPYDSLTV
jgi:hypothetical protein